MTSSPSQPQPIEIPPQLAANVLWINRNGIGIQIMETLAVGGILTAFALQLNASNFIIGCLAAVPHLAQLAQLPAIYCVDRFRNRKTIYNLSGLVARPMMLAIGFCAFLPPDLALPTIILAFVIRYVAGAFLACSWNSWMRDLIPDDAMGKVFGNRQRTMIGVGILLTLGAAAFIDGWRRWSGLDQIYAYTVVYCLSFLGGIYGVWAAAHVDEPAMSPSEPDYRLLQQLKAPLEDRNYRRLIKFLAAWNFATNLAAPFFTVQMLKGMGLDLLTVMGLATISQVTAFATIAQWGIIADRFSNTSVLRVCAPLFVAAVFAWVFTTVPDDHLVTLALLFAIHVAMGISGAGVGLAAGNITLKLAPRGNATAYLATSSMINALSAGSASMLGGLSADFITSNKLSVIVRWADSTGATDINAFSLTNWDFFFVFATVFGIYSLHRLSLIQEPGHVTKKVVINALMANARRSLRNLSTVSGVRALVDAPLSAIYLLRRRRGASKDLEDEDDD